MQDPARGSLRTEKGKRTQIPHTAKRPLAIDSRWERENRVSPMEQHWVCPLYSRETLWFSLVWLGLVRLG